MKRIQQTIPLLLLVCAALGSACSLDKASAQKRPATETASTRPAESPTPGYKPLKRVSRDVIDTEKKEEPAQDKAKDKAKDKKKK